jgi:hypothetical protein
MKRKKKLILKNCEMEFDCPLLWDNKENKRYCIESKEKVYHCKTEFLKRESVFFEIEDIGNLDNPKIIKWEKMGKMSKN